MYLLSCWVANQSQSQTTKNNKMRKVISDSEVCHFWANQLQYEGTNQRRTFYFEDGIIYSYGQHFAIARHATGVTGEKAVLLTCRKYSVTTSSHVYAVARASSHIKQIIAPYPEDYRGERNFAFWETEIACVSGKLVRARKPAIYINQIQALCNQVKEYADFTGYIIPDTLMIAGNITNAAEYTEALNKHAELLIVKEKKEAKERQKKFEENLDKWRRFDLATYYLRGNNTGYDYLRYNPVSGNIETTQGVNMDGETARKFYRVVLDVISRGGCVDCNIQVDGWQVKKITAQFIKVGCHKIAIKEIKALTSKLGW